MEHDINRYKKISFYTNKYCNICDSDLEDPVINLPSYPLTGIYSDRLLDEPVGFIDQAFHYCHHCGHGQLANIVDRNLLFNKDVYSYKTSNSMSGKKSADFFISFINKIANKTSYQTIVEIGCNSLYLLNSLKNKAKHLIGIDPILAGSEKEMSDDKINVIGDFFENVNIDKNIDIIICNY